MPDEKFDLDKYLRLLEDADPSEDGIERENPEPDETAEESGVFDKIARWVRKTIETVRGTKEEIGSSEHELTPPLETPQPLAPSSPQQTETSYEPAQPAAPHSRDVAETSPGCGTRSGGADKPLASSAAAQADDSLHLPPAARAVGSAAHTPAQPDTSRTEGERAPSERAPSTPETASDIERPDTPDTPSAPQPRTHAQPATSPPQQPATPTTLYRGEVAGGSVAERRPNRAPLPSLHSLARALDRELRRYG